MKALHMNSNSEENENFSHKQIQQKRAQTYAFHSFLINFSSAIKIQMDIIVQILKKVSLLIILITLTLSKIMKLMIDLFVNTLIKFLCLLHTHIVFPYYILNYLISNEKKTETKKYSTNI